MLITPPPLLLLLLPRLLASLLPSMLVGGGDSRASIWRRASSMASMAVRRAEQMALLDDESSKDSFSMRDCSSPVARFNHATCERGALSCRNEAPERGVMAVVEGDFCCCCSSGGCLNAEAGTLVGSELDTAIGGA